MRTYTTDELESMPTLHSGQYADLKAETDSERVWLSRMTAEDGETFLIAHEELVDGRWVTAREYARA